MKKTMRSLQKGRSMLEVIAILAVMGILLIAGMVGFKILLDYLKQKETIEQITTIGMRYKADRLKGTSVETKYVPSKQFYPEGNNCDDGTKKDCVTTPEGGNVHLFSIADSKNFVVFTTFNNARTCEEVALMGGYEYAFGLETLPEGNAINKNGEEFFLNNDQGRDPEQTFTHHPTKEQNASQIINSAGESFSFSADYLKKNPNALKVFCDTNIPLGFVYTAGDCKFMCGGVCQSCPCNQVEDNEGTCCKETDIKCGTCGGCKGGEKCLTDNASDPFSGRCVQCINNSDCTNNGEYCQNNKCVQCTGPYYELKDDPDSGEKICECTELNRKLNEDCDADCNCAQGLFCYEDPTTFAKTCKECLIQPDCPGNVPCVNGQCKCDDDHPCPTGQVCCNETCCPAGQFCKDGVCSACTENAQCGGTSKCCNGVCCAEGATCCNNQCCNNHCITVDGQETCGGCDDNSDCPDNEYCDTTEHVCKPCLNEALDICGDSVTENFNTNCYTKKHLNCLDTTDTKDVPGLIQSAPNVNTPICANGAAETDATCNPCTSTAQCQALQSNGDKNRTLLKDNTTTKVGNVLFKDFVCRRNHSGADAQYNGSCGPCIDNTDCGGIPCLESGKCGCEANADCLFKCDGKTTCNTGNKNCACTSPLTTDGAGNCVCPTNSDKIWRLNNNSGNAQYACCPEGELPSNGECYPECTNETSTINNVKIFVDHSYSTIVGSTRIAENIENTRKLIRRLINNVGRTISVSESNEYTGNDALTVTRTIGGESITFTAYNCGDNGHTCFANPNTDNGAIPAQREGTLTFILSDGVLPEATTKNLNPDYTYVFAKSGTKLNNIENIIPFENLNSNQLEERISGVISTSICMSLEDISGQLYDDCPTPLAE